MDFQSKVGKQSSENPSLVFFIITGNFFVILPKIAMKITFDYDLNIR